MQIRLATVSADQICYMVIFLINQQCLLSHEYKASYEYLLDCGFFSMFLFYLYRHQYKSIREDNFQCFQVDWN
jgi:hypothetical protein